MSVTTKRHHRRQPSGADGVAGNEHLTALTGVVLLVGFAIEGVTILRIGRLLTLHFFLGLLLDRAGAAEDRLDRIPDRPLLHRCDSVRAERAARAPAAAARPVRDRDLAGRPGHGCGLAVVGPDNGSWLFLHKASFILWLGFMTLHVLAHIWRLPRILRAPGGQPSFRLTGGAGRWLLVAASLAGGLVIALLAVHLAGPWEAARFGHDLKFRH